MDVPLAALAHEFQLCWIQLFGERLVKDNKHQNRQRFFFAEIADADHGVEVLPVDEPMAVEVKYFIDSALLSLRNKEMLTSGKVASSGNRDTKFSYSIWVCLENSGCLEATES